MCMWGVISWITSLLVRYIQTSGLVATCVPVLCGSVALASVLKAPGASHVWNGCSPTNRTFEILKRVGLMVVLPWNTSRSNASRLELMRSCSWSSVRKISGFWAGGGRDGEGPLKQAKIQASHLLELAVRKLKHKASLHFMMPHSRDVGPYFHCLLNVGEVEPSTNVFCGSLGH
jgi:hypothetical protein